MDGPKSTPQVSAAERYAALKGDRTGPLDRARRNAKLTIPHIFPPEGADEGTALYDPFQTVGFQGVNNLASKMTLAVMPPNTPFFRHDPDTFAMDEFEAMNPGAKRDALRQLARYDRAAMRKIEASGDRPKVEQAMRHLLIGGNVLIDLREPTMRVIGLANYVTRRANRGQVLELVIEEEVYPASLSDDIRAVLPESTLKATDEPIKLYTQATFDGKLYQVFQEIEGKIVPGSDGSFKPEDMPFLALRFYTIDGQNYGRSFVEGCYGDLTSLESLTEALVDAAGLASFILFLVNPNGSTKVSDVEGAATGSFRNGRKEDITTLQLDKYADMRVTAEKASQIEESLKDIFLLRSSVTREAERVTAEEIRFVALEIEDALAGIYSVLSQEFQLPYVRIKLNRMKDLPKLPKDIIDVTITTGLEALRRSHELQKLDQWVARMAQVYGPQKVAMMLNPESYGDLVAASLGLDLDGLINDADEQAQSALSDAAVTAAPGIIQGAMTNAIPQDQAV
jgi:hypothetical protein